MTAPIWQHLEAMPFGFSGPAGSGVIRTTADDFQVDEILGLEPDGEGEHVLLHLRKRNTNTIWLARQLASLADVANRDVSYAGLKDRHAVTSQWFSIRLAGRPEPDWQCLRSEQIEILRVARHRRKLKTGTLQGNRFLILVREVQADRQRLEAALEQIQQCGMPNYFGEQRFGREYANLQQAQRLFDGKLVRPDRKLRGLLISAARSQLFNEVLAARIEQQNWNQPIAGDHMQLAGNRAGFSIDDVDAEISRRCQLMDIHPSGPLWGRGRSMVSHQSLELEQAVLKPYAAWQNSLEHVGLKQERRPLRIQVGDLRWRFPDHYSLQLDFSLPAGCYATVLLRELLQLNTHARVCNNSH